MTPLRESLARISAALNDLEARFALVGGLGVSVRTEPRFTRDIDLAVAMESDDAAEELVRALRGRGFRATGHLEQQATGRLATVRLTEQDEESAVVDLLFASSGIEPEIVAAAEALEVLPGVTVPVARTPHLIALKVLAGDAETRPQDHTDARALLAVAASGDLDEVHELLGLIVERGFARGRDLRAGLERLAAR